MSIYELSPCGIESHCSHLESFTYPRVSHKDSEGRGKVFDIFDFWPCWVLFCIELTDLIPTNFFKEIVIVLPKMHTVGEIIVKICLKARYIFFRICSSQSSEGQERWAWRKVIHLIFLLGGGGEIWQNGGKFENLSMRPPPNPCPLFSDKLCTHILNLVLPK